MKLEDLKRVHFVGVGGIGMSALARYFSYRGISVSGSDLYASNLIDELLAEGMEVEVGLHTGRFFTDEVELVVYSEAVEYDNFELEEADAKKIPKMSYAQGLGFLSANMKTIAVSGAHGKSTTTAMLGLAMESLGLDPTVIVGTRVPQFDNKNIRFGSSEYFVVEACEYRRSFLNLKPYASIILNLDEEHLDYYRDLEDYTNAFKDFSDLISVNGFLVVRKDLKDFFKDVVCTLSTYSNLDSSADYFLNSGKIFHWSDELGSLKLFLNGEHNYANALSVVALLHQLGFDMDKVLASLALYQGSWRRFEFKGKYRDEIDVYDDYAHHPTEIQATLKAARERFDGRRIVCVFQPHQYSRTIKLLPKFLKSFFDADEVIIPNIYKVRDKQQDVDSMSAQSFVDSLAKEQRGRVVYGGGLDNTVSYLKASLKSDDVVILMGAGDVYKIAEKLI